jgi:hypothetical protein
VNSILSFIAAALLIIGLAGNGFEMRKILLSKVRDEELASKEMFMNKSNFKWYAIIGMSLLLWATSNIYT